MIGLRHVLLSQHLLFLPGPPNLGISRQNLQSPQSSLLQPEQVPHFFRLVPIEIEDCYTLYIFILSTTFTFSLSLLFLLQGRASVISWDCNLFGTTMYYCYWYDIGVALLTLSCSNFSFKTCCSSSLGCLLINTYMYVVLSRKTFCE